MITRCLAQHGDMLFSCRLALISQVVVSCEADCDFARNDFRTLQSLLNLVYLLDMRLLARRLPGGVFGKLFGNATM